MIRKKVLGVGVTSATLLVQDTEAGGTLRVLKRINVSAWDAPDVTDAFELYKTLQASHIPHMIPLHTVLLQGSFLNLVTAYCAGGDVLEYLEDDVTTAVPAETAARWLLTAAEVLDALHTRAARRFHGPALSHLFFDGAPGGAVCVGPPVPRAAYWRGLAERRAQGVAVEREYPPEVLQTRAYHPTASDVWHLGLAGLKLLSAHTAYARRPPALRDAIAAMMEPTLERRVGTAEARRLLRGCLGEETPAEETPRANPRPRLPESWHRHALEQFEELRRMQASPPRRGAKGGQSPPAAKRVSVGERPSRAARPSHGRGSGSGSDVEAGVAQRLRHEQSELARRRELLRRDNEQRRRRQREEERAAQDVHRHHMDKMKAIRGGKRDGDVKSDMRRHIRQWRENGRHPGTAGDKIIVSEHGGVSVFAPKWTPPAAQTGNDPNASSQGTSGRENVSLDGSRAAVAPPSRPPASPPRRSTSAFRQRGMGPGVPSTRAHAPPSAAGEEMFDIPSTLSAGGHSTRPVEGGGRRAENSKPENGERRRTGAALLASIEFSANSLRESLRRVVEDSSICEEALDVVYAFVLRSDAERHNPRFNVVFMNTLRDLIGDEKKFLAVGPMCAQLVALQSLSRFLNSQSLHFPD